MRKLQLQLICISGLLLTGPTARAQLSATVEPGYQFTAGERYTSQKFNLLGLPTVTVVGTVTGATLSTNSVGKVHVSTNVFDQVTILGGDNVTASVNYDDYSLGVRSNALAVLAGGIRSEHVLDASLTGDDVDTNTLTYANFVTNWPESLTLVTPATNDYVLIGDVSDATNLVAATVQDLVSAAGTPLWYTNDVSINSEGVIFETEHGLARVPWRVTGWLVCTNATNGFELGDRIDALNPRVHPDGNSIPVFNMGCNGTNVWVTRVDADTVYYTSKAGVRGQEMNTTNWTLSVNAW